MLTRESGWHFNLRGNLIALAVLLLVLQFSVISPVFSTTALKSTQDSDSPPTFQLTDAEKQWIQSNPDVSFTDDSNGLPGQYVEKTDYWLMAQIVAGLLFLLVLILLWNHKLRREIAMRIKAEADLDRSNTRFRSIFEGTDAISIQGYDKNRRVIYWNPASEKLYGYSAEEAIGKQLEDLIIPDEMREPVISGIAAWIAGGPAVPSSELTLCRADGSSVNVYSSYILTQGANDQPEMYCIDIDLTSSKQAEAEAHQRDLVIDSVFQVLPDFFFLMDMDGTIQDYRAQEASSLYVPPEAFLGKRMQDLLPPEVADQFEENIDLVIQGESLATYEYALEIDDGLRQFEARLTLMPGREQLVAIVRDITEKKQIESERDGLLHVSGERLKELRCMFGLAESIRTSSSLIQIFEKAVELIPQGWQYPEITCARLHFEQQEYVSEQFQETRWKQSADIVVAGNLLGTIEVFYLQECPERDEGPFLKEERELLNGLANTLSEAVRHVQSDKDREKTEHQLRHAKKMDAIGQLTGGIAHDFNNILGVILGNLTLLKPDVSGIESARKRVITIEKSAQRAANLTKQLLGFSRQQTAEVTHADINRVIGGMESLIARTVTPAIEVENKFADDLWLTRIDAGDFQDALLNLIINARDAMPNSGHLILETRNFTMDVNYCSQNEGAIPGDYVELSVIDSGEGIAAEYQDYIFDPFFTTKTQGKGTGLGLAMVFGFVKRSDGYIKVYSEKGSGSTFRIYLPRAEGEEQRSLDITEKLSVPPRGNETILVVDDEEGLLELARDFLLELGYQVVTATKGTEALECLKREPAIDLLFSDVVMPGGISGYELAEQAVTMQPGIKVLLTSGYTGKAAISGDQTRAETNVLVKPYTQLDMASRIREILGAVKLVDSERVDQKSESTQSKAPSSEWSDDLSVGIDAMDEDHKMLFGLLQRCLEVMAEGAAQEKITAIVKELRDSAQYHFGREEAVMAACDYPGLANHIQVHKFLLKEVGKMQMKVIRNKLDCNALGVLLTSWLVDHIQGMDHAYMTYCQGKGARIEQALKLLGAEEEKEGGT